MNRSFCQPLIAIDSAAHHVVTVMTDAIPARTFNRSAWSHHVYDDLYFRRS
jgi:hypothetical protein